MPQNVPPLEWTDDALRLRQFIFEHWCDHGRGPNYRNIHEALGMSRREIIQALKVLQLGIVVVVDDELQNCNLVKAPPFSSFPSQVELFLDDRFHSFIGCASEALAVSNMPPFQGKDCRLESWCACCLEPVTLIDNTFELKEASHPDLRLHLSVSPWDWINHDMRIMCDAMNFVIDAAHADRYERQIGRRGVQVPLDRAKTFVRNTGEQRMHDYHWPAGSMNPEAVVDLFSSLGCDVSAWTGDATPVP